MKKTVTVLSAMLVCVAVFFCVPVHAATGSPAVHKSASGSGSGVTYEINLDQYYPQQNADAGLAAGEVYTQVFYRITNSNDQAAYVRNTGFSINWVTAPYIVSYETYTENLYLGYQNTAGSWYIYGDTPYSYSSGVVVPPNSSLYCIAYIVTSASVNGNAISSQAINSVSLNNHTITLGNYPYGNGTQQIDDIADMLSGIETYFDLTGSLPPVQEVWYARRNRTFADMGISYPSTGFSGSVRIFKSGSFALSETAIGQISGGAYRNNCYVIPFQISLWITNNTGHAVKCSDAIFTFTDFFDRTVNPASLLIYGYDSDLIGMPSFQSLTASNYIDLLIPIKYQYDGYAYIPVGSYRECFTVLAIFDSETPAYTYNNNYGFSCTFTTSDLDISYNPIFPLDELNRNMRSLLEAYNQVNGTGDLSDNSESLTEGLNNAHEAEQNYFEDNSQALAASGISNPNFEASDRTGINSAITGNKNQFGMLWNAIGAWRNVYIYAALMCLVTYLLRHRPWIRSGQGDYRGVLHDKNGGK